MIHGHMKNLLLQVLVLVCATVRVCAESALRPLPLDKANVLPLALDDAFKFRKQILRNYDPELNKSVQHPMLSFERARLTFGAVNQTDRQQRYGQYYTFYWRADRQANLTV